MKPSEDNHNDIIREQVYNIVRAIPAGEVRSYGAVGAQCQPPISGYICGRIMGIVPDDVPWWRVVAKDGSLPIRKRSPDLSIDQREMLRAEGVKFDAEGKVVMKESQGNLFGDN